MPTLIRIPEEVLRQTRRNLYYIRFNVDPFKIEEKEDIPGRKELLDWFAKECPEVELEDLGVAQIGDMVILSGCIGFLLRVDFDKASLAKFCTTWETPEGASLDPRWQCIVYPYKHYLKLPKEKRYLRSFWKDYV